MDQPNLQLNLNSVRPEQKQLEVLRAPEQMTQKEIAQELRQRLGELKSLRQRYLRGEAGPNPTAGRAAA